MVRIESVCIILVSFLLSACGLKSENPEISDNVDEDYLGGISNIESDGGLGNYEFQNIQPEIPSTYTAAKAVLYHGVKDKTTLYCGCDTIIDGSDEVCDRDNCEFEPINDNARAKRLEAEHVVPAFWISKFNPDSSCWGGPSCRAGESGRYCCKRIDSKFNTAHNDLVNLYPSVGSINGARSNYLFTEIEGEKYRFGNCDFETRSRDKIVEPREEVRGDIARIHFYMAQQYGLTFPSSILAELEAWSEEDPLDDEERKRNNLIHNLQGRNGSTCFGQRFKS